MQAKHLRRTITAKKFAKFFFLKYPFSACKRTFPKGYTQKHHVHDFPQIWFTLSGAHTHEVGAHTFHCKKGSFITVPSGVCHSFTVSEKSDAKLVCLEMSPDIFLDCDLNSFPNAAKNLLLSSFERDFNYHVKLSNSSFDKISSLIAPLTLFDASDKSIIFRNLEEIFSLPEFSNTASSFDKILPILRAFSYINENFREKITIDDMVRKTALCRTHFLKYFKEFTGSTFSSYLQEVRLAYAFILIGNSNYPLSHIATLCGFSDAGYMTNCYKKYIGLSPNFDRETATRDFSEYRRSKK